MADPNTIAVFFTKAQRSLEGAESEFANGRYDNSVNRSYYGCFQAAIAALMRAEVASADRDGWRHTFVHSQFVGQLINRRKVYREALRRVLVDLQFLRGKADYEDDLVTQREAARALRDARMFIEAVLEVGGTR